MFANSTNITRPDTAPSWGIVSAYSTVICVTTLTTNGVVLWTFLHNHHLRSNAFTYYLINLMVANLLHAAAYQPLEIIFLLYRNTEKTGGFCLVYFLTGNVSNAMITQSHVLITASRVWAVLFPLTYRSYHSSKAALILCICDWLFLCAFLMPGLLVDGISLRDTADNVHCQLNVEGHPAQRGWFMAVRVLLFQLPICVVLLAYPLIAWKRHHLAKIRVVAPAIGGVNAPSTYKDSAGLHTERKTKSRSFTVLTLLTSAVLVCWTPLVVCYSAVAIFNVLAPPIFYEVAQALWSVEPALDPILFSIAFKQVRMDIKKRPFKK